MNPDRKPPAEEPHGFDEAHITDELCDFISRLDHGIDNPLESSHDGEVSLELQSAMTDCRNLLDFLQDARDTTGFPSVGPTSMESVENFAGYALPAQIGRFKIIERLGFGGYGVVFHALDPHNGRDVAIKIPRPEFLESPELIHRFTREASIVAQLSHPNIVSIYESNSFGIVPYFVMELLEGKTLAEWRAENPDISPQMVATIVRKLALAVSHAHERGVLHRDLKPGNVILVPRDPDTSNDPFAFVPVLTDFGIAQCAEFNSLHTQSGAMIGTMRYMSPEQAEGRTHDITQRTDVYGLGTILYELLTGAPPFKTTNHQQLLQNILNDVPVLPHKKPSSIPVELEVICLKCLEKAPNNRYASADALADDLNRFLNGDPIRARPASWMTRIGKWIRRYPGRAAIIATFFLGLLAMVGITLWFNARLVELLVVAESERIIAHRKELEARRHEIDARQHELVSRRRAYCSDMRNAKISFDRGNVPLMLKLLERYRPRHTGFKLASDQIDIRDFAWWALWRKYTDSSQVLGRHPGEPIRSLSPEKETWQHRAARTASFDFGQFPLQNF